jgi:hypothetical protein
MANDFTGFMPEETGAEQVRVESFFKPNLQLLDKVLATRQTMYNTNLDTMAKAKAKVEEVNSLEGFDRDEWFKMQEDYDNEIGGIMSLYEGDLSKANAELYGFTTKVGKDFGIHGKATAINERALGYMANKKELDKRLAEGKIERAQYWKLQKELEDTAATGIGTDPKTYQGWRKINPMDAIKFPDFAEKFLKNKKESLKLNGYQMQKRGDFIEFVKTGAETISYEEVMDELTAAYNNEAEKTGQLRDAFDYHVYNNKINLTREKYVNAWTEKSGEYQDRINKLSTLKGNDLIQYINSIGGQIKGNIINSEVVAAKMAFLEQAKNYVDGYNERIKTVSDETKFNQQQVEGLYYKEFIESETRRQADPYARAISYSKDILEHSIHKDPRAEFEYAKALKDYEKLQEQVAPIMNYTHGESISIESLLKAKQGLSTKRSELKDIKIRLADGMKKGNLSKEQRLNLENQIDQKQAEIYNIEANYRSIQDDMRKNGYTTTDELLSKELQRLTSVKDPTQLAKWENTFSMSGNDWKNYLEQKEALLSGLSPEQRGMLFAGETDISKIVKTYFNRDRSADGKAEYVAQIIELYDKDKEGSMTNRFMEHVENRMNGASGGDDPWYSSVIHLGRFDSETYFNNLRNDNEEHISNYTENNNINFLTQTTQTITVDPNAKNHIINSEVNGWSRDYAANSSGYRSIGGNQFDSDNKTFYNEKGEETKEDKSKALIEMAIHPVDGKYALIVKHRDSAGKPLRDVKGKESQSMVFPENQDGPGGIKESIKRIGLNEMNWAKTYMTDVSGQFLNSKEQNEADPLRRNRYQSGLTMLALNAYGDNLQNNGIHYMNKKSNRLVDFGGRKIFVYKNDHGNFELYMPELDNTGKPTGKPNYRKQIKFYDASNAYDHSMRRAVPLEERVEFGSIEDISKSIFFTTQILGDVPRQSWED